MLDQDFKQALRHSMAVVTAPPPMSETAVLDAAKRAVRRRRAMWASGASAAAVVALAAGVAFAVPGGDQPVQRVGADVTSTNTAPPSAATDPDWPDGQTDATATSGPRYDRGVTLLDKLADVVPAGFESPNLTGKPDSDLPDTPLHWHQASWNYEDDSWTYDAALPVTKADGVGRLAIMVRTPGKDAAGPKQRPCELSQAELGEGGSCQEVIVGGVRVSVMTGSFGTVGVYRHPDGTVVMVSQAAVDDRYGYSPLSELPFTEDQLAELAADPKFHLD